jgi:hypothetical protein
MNDAKPQTREQGTQGTSRGIKNQDSSQPAKPDLTESTELVSVDDNIDQIAREALEEARRVEEAERYRKTPGPIIPPK